jgi:CRP/FNR family transcriptional regulator, anaerobic regulatory protein
VNDPLIPIRPIHRPGCQNTLFGLLESTEGSHAHRGIEVMDYSAGDAIYRQGQVGHHIHAVCKGLIRLEQKLPDGGTRIVRLLQAGSVFGLELMSNEAFMHTAVSVGKSRVCRTPAPSLQRLAEHDPALHQSLMKEWSEALQEADFVISHLSTGSARQRVARLLLHMSQSARHDGVCQAPPRDNMASLLGLTSETVSRTTAAFKREGMVTEECGVFTCDAHRLHEVSQDAETAPVRLSQT